MRYDLRRNYPSLANGPSRFIAGRGQRNIVSGPSARSSLGARILTQANPTVPTLVPTDDDDRPPWPFAGCLSQSASRRKNELSFAESFAPTWPAPPLDTTQHPDGRAHRERSPAPPSPTPPSLTPPSPISAGSMAWVPYSGQAHARDTGSAPRETFLVHAGARDCRLGSRSSRQPRASDDVGRRSQPSALNARSYGSVLAPRRQVQAPNPPRPASRPRSSPRQVPKEPPEHQSEQDRTASGPKQFWTTGWLARSLESEPGSRPVRGLFDEETGKAVFARHDTEQRFEDLQLLRGRLKTYMKAARTTALGLRPAAKSRSASTVPDARLPSISWRFGTLDLSKFASKWDLRLQASDRDILASLLSRPPPSKATGGEHEEDWLAQARPSATVAALAAEMLLKLTTDSIR